MFFLANKFTNTIYDNYLQIRQVSNRAVEGPRMIRVLDRISDAIIIATEQEVERVTRP